MLVEIFLPSVLLVLSSAQFDSRRSNESDFNLPSLQNDTVIAGYVKCFLDKGPCPPEVGLLKKTLSDVLDSACRNCTDIQKSGIRDVVRVVTSKFPKEWKELVHRYELDKKNKQRFKEFMEEWNHKN